MNKLFLVTVAVCLGGVLLLCQSAQSAPEKINYQGRLIEGTNLYNGQVGIVFRLYDTATGTNVLYQETQTVTVVDGLYAAQIGSASAVGGALRGVFQSNDTVYLEVEISGAALQPREQLNSVGYALAVDSAAAWKPMGNTGLVQGVHFVGTVDSQGLDIRVNNRRAVSIIPHSISPIIVMGHSNNVVRTNAPGCVIGGGGSVSSPNVIETYAQYCVIGGGTANRSEHYTYDCFIGGGVANVIDEGVVYGVIGGGAANVVGRNSYGGTVAGGFGNEIASNVFCGAIVGGLYNVMESRASNATICAGCSNVVGAGAVSAFMGGGAFNHINSSGSYSVVAGGANNSIGKNAEFAVVNGGGWNTIEDHARAAIIGGFSNMIARNCTNAVISGGAGNRIGTNAASAIIGGGSGNRIETGSEGAAILSGGGHLVNGGSRYSCIGGGENNAIGTGAVYAVIAGGRYNSISNNAYYSGVLGGEGNRIGANATHSFIGGGYLNVVATNSRYSVVVGGLENSIGTNTQYAFVGGGSGNAIGNGANYAVVGGGLDNDVATNASYATIPGGRGCRAMHAGVFLWADSQGGGFSSVTSNEVAFRCGNGVRFTSGSAGGNQTVQWAPGDGSWSFSSDRALKDDVRPVNVADVLSRLRQVPISEWNYKGYTRRHIGPMAQDFHRAFSLGDERSLNSLDLDGVALAAIQALAEENDRLRERLAVLEEQIQDLVRARGKGTWSETQ